MACAISIYGSHDSSICILPQTDVYRIYEFERLLRKRNCNISHEPEFREHLLTVRRLIEKEYGITAYGNAYYAQLDAVKLEIFKEVFAVETIEEMSHHAGHAAGAIYQTDFEQCLVISSDSGGHELPSGIATFCIFLCDKTQHPYGRISKIADIPLDACGAYTLMAVPLREIKKEDAFTKYLTYAGKIMGLAAYGNVIQEWLPAMRKFYYGNINLEELKKLGEAIGINLSGINTIEGRLSYDIAATSQYVFEELTFNAVMPYVQRYNLPVVLTGGGALNVLLNEQFRRKLEVPVAVPVNPNDCGLSFGFMCLRNPPHKKVEIQYNGFPILDYDRLQEYVIERKAKRVSIYRVAELIQQGKIIGVLRGNSECGARALGNRSILCNPAITDIKDILNKKVKFREWFRPFAPVVRMEDAGTYFSSGLEHTYMSYAPAVREEWRDKVPGIVHEDGTARLQTVTKEQNKYLYMLLTVFRKLSGIPMLLNTSFNVKGEPILTCISDALKVLDETELDAVMVDNYLFTKQ